MEYAVDTGIMMNYHEYHNNKAKDRKNYTHNGWLGSVSLLADLTMKNTFINVIK